MENPSPPDRFSGTNHEKNIVLIPSLIHPFRANKQSEFRFHSNMPEEGGSINKSYTILQKRYHILYPPNPPAIPPKPKPAKNLP